MDYERLALLWMNGDLQDDSLSAATEQRRFFRLCTLGCATDEQTEAAGSECSRGAKSVLPGYRDSGQSIVEKADGESFTIPWVMSDESVDRMGDIIRVAGWDLRNFARNNILLLGHDSYGTPIGTVQNVRKATGDTGSPALVGEAVFASNESEKAAQAYRLARSGVYKSGSVGFLPKRISVIDSPEERAKLGLGKWGVVYEEQELLEFSIVSVPANPNAVQMALESKGITDADAAYCDTETKRQVTERDMATNARARLQRAMAMAHVCQRAQAIDPRWEGQEILSVALKSNTLTGSELSKAIQALGDSQLLLAKAVADLGGHLGESYRDSEARRQVASSAEGVMQSLRKIETKLNKPAR